jgi:hypothetical protein
MDKPPKGSGGIVCNTLMLAYIAQAGTGVLSTSEGGQELRELYYKGLSIRFLFILLC